MEGIPEPAPDATSGRGVPCAVCQTHESSSNFTISFFASLAGCFAQLSTNNLEGGARAMHSQPTA